MRKRWRALLTVLLSLWWMATTLPVAAQGLSTDAKNWYATCVTDLKSKYPELKDQSFSIRNSQDDSPAITVDSTDRRMSRSASECARRLGDAFRMTNQDEVNFSFGEIDTSDYKPERCKSRLNELTAPKKDRSLKSYIELILACTDNKKKLEQIKSWISAPDRKKNKGFRNKKNRAFRNIDVRFFDLVFAKAEACAGHSDVQSYYLCLTREISKDDGGNESVSNSESPVIALVAPAAVAPVIAPVAPAPVAAAPVAPAPTAQAPVAPAPVAPVAESPSASSLPTSNDGTQSAGPVEGQGTPTAGTALGEVPPAQQDSALADPSVRSPPTAGEKNQPSFSKEKLSSYLPYFVIFAVVTVFAFGLGLARFYGVLPGSGIDKTQKAREQRGHAEMHDTLTKSPNLVGRKVPQLVPASEPPLGQIDDGHALQKIKFDDGPGARPDLKALLEKANQQYQDSQSKLAEAQRNAATLERDFVAERNTLNSKCGELEEKIKSITEENASLSRQLEYFKSEEKQLESGLPAFVSPGDLKDPLTDFWIRAAKSSPQSYRRLDGALRSYKIASEDSEAQGSRIFDLVNEVGLQLYALMDSMNLDESEKREEAAKWQAALNRDGKGRFLVSVLYAGTVFEFPHMLRKDERVKCERIKQVRSWVVKDKEDRTARRAIVE